MQADPQVLSQPGSAQKVPGLLLKRLQRPGIVIVLSI